VQDKENVAMLAYYVGRFAIGGGGGGSIRKSNQGMYRVDFYDE